MNEYILTEDNTMIGIQGMVIGYSEYRLVPYMDRCLFMKISPDHDFRFEATAQFEGHAKKEFKFQSAEELNHFLHINALDDEKELIYFTIGKPKAISYITKGTQWFTFTRLK